MHDVAWLRSLLHNFWNGFAEVNMCARSLSCPRNDRRRSWSVSERMAGFSPPTWLESFRPPRTPFGAFCAIWQLRDYAPASTAVPSPCLQHRAPLSNEGRRPSTESSLLGKRWLRSCDRVNSCLSTQARPIWQPLVPSPKVLERR